MTGRYNRIVRDLAERPEDYAPVPGIDPDRGFAAFGAELYHHEPPAFGRKVGRNEPCPCGSGRKYKRCGAH